MSATPSRIGFVMQPVRRATSESPETIARHGALARRDEEPQETFFVNVSDAQAIASARQDLLGPERRRFDVSVKGLTEVLDHAAGATEAFPARYVDELRGVDRSVLVAEVGFDFAKQQATLVVWG